jgi:hypothetical protein
MKDSFKNKLKQHRPEWDKDAFWAELEPELPKEASPAPLRVVVLDTTSWHTVNGCYPVVYPGTK